MAPFSGFWARGNLLPMPYLYLGIPGVIALRFPVNCKYQNYREPTYTLCNGFHMTKRTNITEELAYYCVNKNTNCSYFSIHLWSNGSTRGCCKHLTHQIVLILFG